MTVLDIGKCWSGESKQSKRSSPCKLLYKVLFFFGKKHFKTLVKLCRCPGCYITPLALPPPSVAKTTTFSRSL